MEKNLLIIDDDVDFGSQVGEFLEFEGYNVQIINEPANVKNIEGQFDIFLIDLKMPNISGVDLIRYIRKTYPGSALYVISGLPSLEKFIKDEGLREYINGCLSKPFSPEKLLEILQSS
ncbi:MAG: response regulator [Candidatus Omnitrophota bacterium]